MDRDDTTRTPDEASGALSGDRTGLTLHELRVDHPDARRRARQAQLRRRPSTAIERVEVWRSARRRHRWDWLAALFGLRDAA